MLFQSKSFNKKQATLIFSTHYIELLDIFDRNDVIHVVRNQDGVENYKLSEVTERNDILNSKAYNIYMRESSPAYEQKMEVRKLFTKMKIRN